MTAIATQPATSAVAERVRADLAGHHPLSAEQIARFRRDGFIKLKDVLAPETLAWCGAAITGEVMKRRQDKPMASRTTYEKAFLQIMNLWTVNEAVREFTVGHKLARLAAELMGVAGVRLYHDQALYKEPGGGHTPWHCDQQYWPLATDHTVTVWVPLQSVPEEMGPLSFSIGSHAVDFGRALEISDDSEREVARRLKLSDLPTECSPFDLGEISFHGGWTFHRAPANQTDRLRSVMTVIYHDADAHVAAPANRNQENDLATWLPGLKAGDLAASPINPELYRVDSAGP